MIYSTDIKVRYLTHVNVKWDCKVNYVRKVKARNSIGTVFLRLFPNTRHEFC